MLSRAILTAAAFSTSISTACEVTPLQLQAQTLSFLQSEYPSRKFALGKTDDVIVMGDVELGLQNLHSKICLKKPPMGLEARQEELRGHFKAVMSRIQERQPTMPSSWAEAQGRLFPQLMPTDYVRMLGKERIAVTRPFAPGVELGVVIDRSDSYEYVREEDRARWAVEPHALFDAATTNLSKKRRGVKLHSAGTREIPLLILQERDGYDAASVMVPWVREEAARVLGNPFFVAIPDRDLLVMWSIKSSAGFQSSIRSKVNQDFRSRPYSLLPVALRVWSDGRVEPAP